MMIRIYIRASNAIHKLIRLIKLYLRNVSHCHRRQYGALKRIAKIILRQHQMVNGALHQKIDNAFNWQQSAKTNERERKKIKSCDAVKPFCTPNGVCHRPISWMQLCGKPLIAKKYPNNWEINNFSFFHHFFFFSLSLRDKSECAPVPVLYYIAN